MSSSNGYRTNGSVTLKSFAQLADVLDLDSLPPGPSDSDVAITTTVENPVSPLESASTDDARTRSPAFQDLAG